jgi:hypothetical protein
VLLPLTPCHLFANTGEPLMVSGPGPLVLMAGILALVNLGTLVPVGTSDARLSLWYLIFAWVNLLCCNGCTSPELLLLLLLRSDTVGWFVPLLLAGLTWCNVVYW